MVRTMARVNRCRHGRAVTSHSACKLGLPDTIRRHGGYAVEHRNSAMTIMSATKVRSPSKPAEPPAAADLDRTDRAILRHLQRDASISNVALAAKVSLSAPACLRRVER